MNTISIDILRIIDANMNRMSEGLRVLEEFARLSLNDAVLTQQLKDMRHEILLVASHLQEQLIQARDSEGDVGAGMEVPGEEKTRDNQTIIVANARRVQESLRVMEELAKKPGIGLKSDKYRQARFALYAMEKELFSRMLRQDKMKNLKGLYVIIDTAALGKRDPVEVTSQAIQGGAQAIQLRDKGLGKKELIKIAQQLQTLCSEHGILFIVNDYLDVALAVDTDGLHIGEDDLPVDAARRLLPTDKVLGCSARTVDEAKKACSEGADYLGVGAMYATSTRESSEVVGTERLKEIRKAVDLPLVAIGGINKDNVKNVMEAGAVAVSVINAVMGTTDIKRATRQLVKIIEGVHRG